MKKFMAWLKRKLRRRPKTNCALCRKRFPKGDGTLLLEWGFDKNEIIAETLNHTFRGAGKYIVCPDCRAEAVEQNRRVYREAFGQEPKAEEGFKDSIYKFEEIIKASKFNGFESGGEEKR